MRSFISACSAIAALILTTIAVPLVWAQQNIVSQNGFVALAGPIGSDPEFQKALASASARAVTSQISAAPALASVISPLVEKATASLASDPGYPAAWTETLRRSQELTVIDPSANANDSGVLNLDVAPLLQLVVNKMTSAVGQNIQVPQQVLISVGSKTQRMVIVQAAEVTSVGIWLALAGGFAFVLALLTARYRSVVLIWMGIGGLFVAAAWWFGGQVVSWGLDRSESTNQVADLFKQKFLSAATASYTPWVLTGLGVAVAFLIVGIIARSVSQSRRIEA